MSLGVQTGPLFSCAGDLIADRRYQWAIAYLARGDRPGAAEILEQVLETAPAFAGAWFALGTIREAEGDRDRAITAFLAARNADPQDYHGARLRLARLGMGEATAAMMQVHVRRLFDQHAPRFEQSLLQHLDYRGPQLLLAAVTAARSAGGKILLTPVRRLSSLPRLRCGTGPAGAAFRARGDRPPGIGLSPALIEAARGKALFYPPE